MGTPADIQKLIDNVKRASALTDRAAASVPRDSAIMDRFEARMNLKDETMAKIDAYEKQLAAMDVGNGGPALDATFSSTEAGTATGAVAGIVGPSTPSAPQIHHDTGDPVK